MARAHGFTLLELLLVVSIIGVLSSLAIPQYLKTVERARMIEAMVILGQLRSAQIRYKAQTGKFTNKLTDLDFSPTDVSGTPIYEYRNPVTDAKGLTFDIQARRMTGDGLPAVGTGCEDNYALHVDHTGKIAGQDCQEPASE